MRGSGLRKQALCIKCVPNDLLHIIFSKLDFRGKINAGMVCKEWEQLLQTGTAAARHWELIYCIEGVARSTEMRTSVGQSPQELSAVMGRWFTKRAPAIESVHMFGNSTFLDDEEQTTTREFLEAHLPMLAACLSRHAPTVVMEFIGGSPFESPLLSSPAIMMLLCPMVKWLRLQLNKPFIGPAQFAAICQLTRLEQLDISDGYDILEHQGEYGGLQALTSDISKLVNLRVLTLDVGDAVGFKPESIRGLQKLEWLELRQLHRYELMGPTAIGDQGLKSLSTVTLADHCLDLVPWKLCGLSALTSLELQYCSSVPLWVSTTSARLTRLAELTIFCCDLDSLPSHVPSLSTLTMLDISENQVTSLPEELSNLRNLRELRMSGNHFREVPVCVLGRLTALSVIHLSNQEVREFHISSPLLPILHPGLVELHLRQDKPWDTISQFHQRQAMAEVAGRTPVPALHFH